MFQKYHLLCCNDFFLNIPYSKKLPENVDVKKCNITLLQKNRKKKKLAYGDIFLEYSLNIPYSKKNRILVVMDFLWNIQFYVFS